jgi:hypothetical protein
MMQTHPRGSPSHCTHVNRSHVVCRRRFPLVNRFMLPPRLILEINASERLAPAPSGPAFRYSGTPYQQVERIEPSLGLEIPECISLGSGCPRNPVELPVSVGPALPETQAARPAFRHRTPRSPAARYTKRRCQGSFGSFFRIGMIGQADEATSKGRQRWRKDARDLAVHAYRQFRRNSSTY